jgi:hypothetical protein
MQVVKEDVTYYEPGDTFRHTPTLRVEIIIKTSDGLYLLRPDDLHMTKLHCHTDKISAEKLEHCGGIFDAEFEYIGKRTLDIVTH